MDANLLMSLSLVRLQEVPLLFLSDSADWGWERLWVFEWRYINVQLQLQFWFSLCLALTNFVDVQYIVHLLHVLYTQTLLYGAISFTLYVLGHVFINVLSPLSLECGTEPHNLVLEIADLDRLQGFLITSAF